MNTPRTKAISRKPAKKAGSAKPLKKPLRIAPKSKALQAPAPREAKSVSYEPVAINRADFDGSMTAVLDTIKWRNANGRILVGYSIGFSEVTLMFQ